MYINMCQPHERARATTQIRIQLSCRDDGFSKAEKQAQAEGNKAVARELGPLGTPAMPDVSMVVQVPITPKPLPEPECVLRSLSAPPPGGSPGMCYRSLGGGGCDDKDDDGSLFEVVLI